MKKSTLSKNQVKTFTKYFVEEGQKYKIEVKVRYDDECRNGYNSFGITGTIYRVEKNGRLPWDSCGCIHDEIKKHFPELKKYIKWHLCSSEGPLHYVENTVYLAGDKDCWGKAPGEPKGYKKAIKFEGFPVKFKLKEKFIESLNGYRLQDLNIIKIYHDKESNTYRAKYTLSCYFCEWYECPFDTIDEAEEFLQAFKTIKFEVIETPTGYSEGKQRELDAARATGIWEDATDEELSQDSGELKKVLEARLPALMDAFVADIEELGFIF